MDANERKWDGLDYKSGIFDRRFRGWARIAGGGRGSLSERWGQKNWERMGPVKVSQGKAVVGRVDERRPARRRRVPLLDNAPENWRPEGIGIGPAPFARVSWRNPLQRRTWHDDCLSIYLRLGVSTENQYGKRIAGDFGQYMSESVKSWKRAMVSVPGWR